jgi:hypothetical protein
LRGGGRVCFRAAGEEKGERNVVFYVCAGYAS